MLGDADVEVVGAAAMVSGLGPGDHACLPFRHGPQIDPLVASFLADGFVRGECCLLATSPARSAGVLSQLHARGLAVSELTSRGALLVADVESFYRPDGRIDPGRSLATVIEVAREARAAGYTGLRGAGGPLAWSSCTEADQKALGEYETQVNAVLQQHGVAALCLYDEGSAGPLALRQMMQTHPRAILNGRLRANPFCQHRAESQPESPAQVQWMLETLREGSGPAGSDEPPGSTAPASSAAPASREGPLMGHVRRMAAELSRLKAREAFRSEEVESRNSLLRAVSRQLDPQLAELEATLAQGPDADGVRHLPTGDWLERLRETTSGLRRLARQLEHVSQYVTTPAPLTEEPTELAAVTASTMESWRRSRHIDGTDVRLQATTPVTGRWDTRRISAIVRTVLETAWERGWGSPVDLYVEDLGIKARLTAVFEDMEVMAGSPFDAPASAALVTTARDNLRVALWSARESARNMGGALGMSVWPDGRVSVTIDLPRTAG